MNKKKLIVILSVSIVVSILVIGLGVIIFYPEKTPTPDDNKATLLLTIGEVEERNQTFPLPPPNTTYREIRIPVKIENLGPDIAIFDEIQISFYGNEALVCGATFALSIEGYLICYYAVGDNLEPPSVDTENVFEIQKGSFKEIIAESINCNFALYKEKTIVVVFVQNNKISHGPYNFNITNS